MIEISTIEVVFDAAIRVANNLKAIVVPHTLKLQGKTAPWISSLEESGVDVVPYHFVPAGRRNTTTHFSRSPCSGTTRPRRLYRLAMPLPSGYIKLSDDEFPSFCLPLFSFGNPDPYVQVPSADGRHVARFAELLLPKDTQIHKFKDAGKPVEVDDPYHFLLIIDSIHWFLGYDQELNVWVKEYADRLNTATKLQLAEIFPNDPQWLRAESKLSMLKGGTATPPPSAEVLWRSIEAETLYNAVFGSLRDIRAADLIRSVRRGLMLRSGLLVDDFIPEDVWNLIRG